MQTTPHVPKPPPLRDVRRAHGLSLREVSRRANVDLGHLSRVERGEARLSYEALIRVARVLDLPIARQLAPYAGDDR